MGLSSFLFLLLLNERRIVMDERLKSVKEIIHDLGEGNVAKRPIVITTDGRAEAVKAYLEYAERTGKNVSSYDIERIIEAFDD